MDPGYWPISSNKPSHEGTFEILVEDIQPLDHENIQTIKDDNSQSKDEKELAIKHQEFETIKDELHQRESVISLHQNLSETTEKKNLRFCSYCKISQPYRTKHCRDCEKCVSLYDHHCPWIGGCVGQNNRIYFFWYVFLQCIELWIALYYCVNGFEKNGGFGIWIYENAVRVGILLVISMFGCMVTCLFGFHCFLALNNYTTWEYLSWSKIPYLKDVAGGSSPFSAGIKKNLYQYCCERFPPFKSWEFVRE